MDRGAQGVQVPHVNTAAEARAAGAASVGVTWGYHPGEALKEAGALAVIDRFANLVPTLDAIWAT